MTQKQAYDEFFPYIKDTGKEFYKCGLVYSRLANENEFVETWTADGLETTNYAKFGDFVLQNLQTHCQEEYIVSREQFFNRYKFFYWFDKGCVCIPQGRIIASQYTGEEIVFLAAWNRYMVLKPGDFIVSPLPDLNEVYRIASQEFFETYSLAEDED
jgi:hypothetical protein